MYVNIANEILESLFELAVQLTESYVAGIEPYVHICAKKLGICDLSVAGKGRISSYEHLQIDHLHRPNKYISALLSYVYSVLNRHYCLAPTGLSLDRI